MNVHLAEKVTNFTPLAVEASFANISTSFCVSQVEGVIAYRDMFFYNMVSSQFIDWGYSLITLRRSIA